MLFWLGFSFNQKYIFLLYLRKDFAQPSYFWLSGLSSLRFLFVVKWRKVLCLSLIFETEATLEWELPCHLLVSPFVYLTLLWDIWNPPAQYKTFVWQVGPPHPLMGTAHVKKSCWTHLILFYVPESINSSDLIT